MATVSFISAAKLVELVRRADAGAGLFVRVLSSTRLALGKDPMKPTLAIDLSKENVAPYNPLGSKSHEIAEPAGPPVDAVRVPRSSRRSGRYSFELLGKHAEFGSLHELLGGALRDIEAARPGSLEKLSHIKPRSKRIVAPDKKLLFAIPRSGEKYGQPLGNGWWYGTNNSSQETNAWLERACSCAGLKWQTDLKTNFD